MWDKREPTCKTGSTTLLRRQLPGIVNSLPLGEGEDRGGGGREGGEVVREGIIGEVYDEGRVGREGGGKGDTLLGGRVGGKDGRLTRGGLGGESWRERDNCRDSA